MSIRAKLAWTFILLLIFGITAISSYSILFIRNYLLEQGEEQIINDTEWLSITIENLQNNAEFETNLNEAARTSGYRLAIYDEDGMIFASVPYDDTASGAEVLEHPEGPDLRAYQNYPVDYLYRNVHLYWPRNFSERALFTIHFKTDHRT